MTHQQKYGWPMLLPAARFPHRFSKLIPEVEDVGKHQHDGPLKNGGAQIPALDGPHSCMAHVWIIVHFSGTYRGEEREERREEMRGDERRWEEMRGDERSEEERRGAKRREEERRGEKRREEERRGEKRGDERREDGREEKGWEETGAEKVHLKPACCLFWFSLSMMGKDWSKVQFQTCAKEVAETTAAGSRGVPLPSIYGTKLAPATGWFLFGLPWSHVALIVVGRQHRLSFYEAVTLHPLPPRASLTKASFSQLQLVVVGGGF